MRTREWLAVMIVLVIVVLAFATGESTPRIVTATDEVVVQPVVTNDVCILYLASQTTTHLLPASGNILASTTFTTVTYTASTVTVYENATIFSGSSTCTEINPYYHPATEMTPCGICA